MLPVLVRLSSFLLISPLLPLPSSFFLSAVYVIGGAECGVVCADSGCGHADPTLSVPATHAVGLVCDSSMTCADVEGVLNGGVVEKVCSWVEGEKDAARVLGLLRVVDKLCVGLKGALRSAQKQEQEQNEKEKQKVKSGKEQGQAGQNKEESRDGWSLGSRCQSALDLMENTLLGLCSTRESEEKEKSVEVEVTAQAGGILVVHFPHVLSRGRKDVGVIGVDVGGERRAMEEREKQREEEVKKRLEELDTMKQAMMREADERRKEHELKMADLNDRVRRHKQLIEEGEERERRTEEDETMKRQSKVGAAAIEWFSPDLFSLSGSLFAAKGGSGCPTLLSVEFGKVVVRFIFTFTEIRSRTRLGLIASAQTEKAKGGSFCSNLLGGAGWDFHKSVRSASQHGKEVQKGSACAAARDGQRVVLEADGRDGKRTLRLSQDGQTQPTFFSNIPVPFRFVIQLDFLPSIIDMLFNGRDEGVSIDSVEVVQEPQLSGEGIGIPMDEA
ncbi:hypothetical protein BLNAU_18464 [Blattamonas nauphoetae]|uniref:Uncharacterized protein n=1 Tax=Blattamonas nauphoetae TaxID=2049346 RepID=A0ABQ9X4C7_9EUKA|nr:hypothetical protein BLNAU_18464 [Blattamonas nauphoetae]